MSARQDWRTALSPQQRAVVDWVRTGRGSLNLVARAGCGKTHTLIRGALRAIVEQTATDEVAVMAYNKAAGDEFKQRIEALATELAGTPTAAALRDWKRVTAGTVHSFGFSVVRRAFKGVKVDDKKCADICDALAETEARASNTEPRMTVFRREMGPILKLVSLAKQSGAGFLFGVRNASVYYDLVEHHAINDLTEGGNVDEVVAAAIRVLVESHARDREVVDFDDMVTAPLVHKLRIWPKDWVLLDEAQDTNAARRALALAMLKPRTGRLIAVGDDRQAIYGFTGADSDALDLIARELGSSTLPLTVTYRCPKAVVIEANRLVPDLTAHPSAPDGVVRSIAALRTEKTYTGGVFDKDPAAQEIMIPWFIEEKPSPTDAVLCRNTKPLIETAYAMLAAGLGCRVEGREIGEGLVKLATRWKRLKTLPALDEKLEDYAAREVAKWQAKGREDRAQAAEDKVGALRSVIAALRAEGQDEVEHLVDWIRSLFGDTRPGVRPNVVTLSTIHKAKGREWPRVYLLHKQTTLPSPYARKPWQQRQEENLEYVAITRAKEELVYVD